MKIASICALLFLLSIVAYVGFSDALGGAARPPSAMPAARLAEYTFLHQTRNEPIAAAPMAAVNVCAE